MRKKQTIYASILLLIIFGSISFARAQSSAAAADETDNSSAHQDALIVVRRLTSRDALERQRAAEELARLADPEPRHLVEGYRLQEKNPRVRLALDWALYRMGKPEALFGVVQALDSSRSNQAEAYLAQLETPEPLYKFLNLTNTKTQIKLLESFARNGNEATLERLKPYTAATDPQLADAAQFATREITRRLAQPPANKSARPRQTSGVVSSSSP